MKKLLVFVASALVLAGLTAMAHAGQDVFKDSWLHPMSMWMGQKQDASASWPGYAASPGTHGINTESGPPYNDAVVTDPADPTNSVAQILYNKGKETWSGRTVRVYGSETATLNLSGSSALSFRVRTGASMGSDPVNVSKISMTDTTNVERAHAAIVATSAWASYTIPVTGYNLSGVNKLFTIIMTDAQGGNLATVLEVLLDDIKYEDSSSGKVIVTMTQGVVGVLVEQSIYFTDLDPALMVPNAALHSGQISDLTRNHFIVTNIGSANCKYSLNLINPSGWAADAPTQDLNASYSLGTDRFGMYGIFTDGTAPGGISDYKGSANTADADVITTTPKEATAGTATSAVYGGVGLNNGYNVPAGAGLRSLWIGLKLPGSLSTGVTNMEIIVAVSAAAM